MQEKREEKSIQQNITGMANSREKRFAEVEHAENAGAVLKRIGVYFAKEKKMVSGMLAVVILGTLCGVYAPSLQSNAIDIIAKSRTGNLVATLILMAVIVFRRVDHHGNSGHYALVLLAVGVFELCYGNFNRYCHKGAF